MAGAIDNTRPTADQVEVSVFGPGYGECIAVHLAPDNWLIVDSCVAPGDTTPAALRYLRSLGIDPAKAVRMIVATHWHDDHVRGLGAVVAACPQASVVFSMALKSDEFLTLVDAVELHSGITTSGVSELGSVLRALETRKSVPKFALADRVLYKGAEGAACEVVSLSPSDRSVARSHQEIARLLPTPGKTKGRLPALRPNNAAVVLHATIGDQSILLGSDLEEAGGTTSGWSDIVESSQRPQAPASLYKVAHHGSATGEFDRIWSELLVTRPIAVLTPFVRGALSLPTKADKARIRERTHYAMTTSARPPRAAKRSERVVEKALADITLSIRAAQPPLGHIRLRARRSNAGAGPWSIELSPGAELL